MTIRGEYVVLFISRDFGLIEHNQKLEIGTPLGTVCLDVHVNTESISDKSNTTNLLSNGRKIISWYADQFQAELLICKPTIDLPLHLKIDDCWAAVWRLKALHDIDSSISFLCSWKEPFAWTEAGPNSGEHLDAQTFSGNGKNITIGTEDGAMLSARASFNNGVPRRLEKELDDLGLVEYFGEGISVPIPNLLTDEMIQVHFLVAWSSDELATWFAVDQKSDQILSSVDIV